MQYTLPVVVVAGVLLVTGIVVVVCLSMKKQRKTGVQENGGQHVVLPQNIQVYLMPLLLRVLKFLYFQLQRMQQGQQEEGVVAEGEMSEEKENVEGEDMPKEEKKDVSEKAESPSVVVVQFTPDEREVYQNVRYYAKCLEWCSTAGSISGE